ncbi:hypothetical protein [Pseudomonas sp. CFBP 13719]|uniref:hypothetical protein n=1 Tax=Pseudomonas sp. CFBP 13719 TaxID=2775303 RepID=UPI00177E157C|nr:hypothetical protein [Pseudomonas sp. CFBP 13719]MBD8681297.1 hypothetical protein [Pseudomonas sp. CFBP 13719]
MILKKPSRFVASALLVLCGTMAIQNFANAAGMDSQPTEQEVVQDIAMLKSSDFGRARTMASKSMDGQSIRFLIENVDITYEGLPNVPRATPVVMDMKDPGCVVNMQDKGWVKAGDDLSFHGARGDLLLVNADLARISNTNHEIGHCIDFTVMPKLKADLAGTGANINSVVNIAMTQALENGGTVDLAGVAQKGAGYVLENRMASYEAGIYSTAVKEAYADLHAVYQTAALTGSFDSFSGVINNYRQAVKWDMNHADDLAVYRILAQEQAAGLKPGDLIGKSHEQVTEQVNAAFTKHFYQDGKLSIHSGGFKSVAEEIHIRAQVTPGLEQAQKDIIARFDAKVLDGSLQASKVEFMSLSQKSIESQQNLLSSGKVAAEHLDQAKEVVAKQMGNHAAALEILGVSSVEVASHIAKDPGMTSLFDKVDHSLSAERGILHNGGSGGSIMRRAIQIGGDYRLSPESDLIRASFKNALQHTDLIKTAQQEAPAPG